MCGIITIKDKRGFAVNGLAYSYYQNQKSRGQEGFGFVGMNSKEVTTYRATKEKDFFKELKKNDYSEIIMHHRFPTSTKNTTNSAHPFTIKRGGKSFYFIHNGVINNDEELKNNHKSYGIKKYESEEVFCGYKRFNDSEALAYEVVLYLLGEKKDIIANGSVAFVCLQTNGKTNRAEKMYFYRNNGSPLKMVNTEGLFSLTSESKNKQAKMIKENKLYYYDYKDKNIKLQEKLKIKNEWRYSGGYGGYNDIYDYDYDSYYDSYTFNNSLSKFESIEEKYITLIQERDNLKYQADILDKKLDNFIYSGQNNWELFDKMNIDLIQHNEKILKLDKELDKMDKESQKSYQKKTLQPAFQFNVANTKKNN